MRRRAAGGGLVALVVVCVATVGLSWASKAQCIREGFWEDGEQYDELCFTDLAILWANRGLGAGLVPYVEADVEYPVLLGAQAGALAAVARGLGAGFAGFLHLHAVVAAGLAVAVLLLLRRAGAPRARLWCWALAPPLALYALWNWDLLALTGLVAALVLHREGRDLGAGIALGLGTAAKLFPGLAVPVLALAGLRAGRPDRAVRTVAGAAGAWLVVNVPVALVAPEGWWHFYAKSLERGATPASTWGALGTALGVDLPDRLLSAGSALALTAGAAAVVAVGLRRLPAAETWRLTCPLLAVFLLTTKVHSPQFDLWLVPVALLALPGLASLAAFVVADAAVVVAEMLQLGARAGETWSPGSGWLAAAVAARAGALVWVAVAGLRAPPPPQRHDGNSSRSSEASVGSSVPSQSGAR